MTNAEFNDKLTKMFAKHPMLATNKQYTLNELVYVLRVDDDRDYSISTNDGKCISSVRETYIPAAWLAKTVTDLEYQEFEDEIDGIIYKYSVIFIDLQ